LLLRPRRGRPAPRGGAPPPPHARNVLLAAKTIRSVRRPPIDRTAVAQLLAMLGRTATELRTLARLSDANTNEDDREKIADCLSQISEMRDALMNALRRQP
jgi:hypothetical protein